MKLTKKALAGVATGALLAGGGIATGVAYASIPDSSTGVLTACRVTGDAGNVRIIDKQAGASCHSYETEISWDTTPGVAGHEIVNATASIPVSGSRRANVTATCPSGKVVTGGGWSQADDVNGADLTLYNSYPDSTTSWTVRLYNTGGSAKNATAYAVCVAQ